jgi:branched-subunit amino acid aminotransferase/4-amino-4-deoxychorismate lyase
MDQLTQTIRVNALYDYDGAFISESATPVCNCGICDNVKANNLALANWRMRLINGATLAAIHGEDK